METKGLSRVDLPGLAFRGRGKVRDIYDLGEALLIVATDRISAFDVIFPDPVPGKGKILTRLSLFWFDQVRDLVENNLITADVRAYPEPCRPYEALLEGRSMLVRKARPLPVECVVRGYLTGSAWKDYREGRPVSGIRLPEGLVESARLETPLFTPSTKAPEGEHDLPISLAEMERLIGSELAEKVARLSLRVYERAQSLAEERGIIIADTKMEFGTIGDDLILIDELLTPDSSRFWPREEYEEGRPQKSFDKQVLRDYLLATGWDQKPPAPRLPSDIVKKTRERYEEAVRRLLP